MLTDLGFSFGNSSVFHVLGTEYDGILKLELLLVILALLCTRAVLQILCLLKIRPKIRFKLLDVTPGDHVRSQIFIIAIVLTQVEGNERLGPPQCPAKLIHHRSRHSHSSQVQVHQVAVHFDEPDKLHNVLH